MKKKIFNIIQIGDKSNRISRAFDFFYYDCDHFQYSCNFFGNL